MNMFQLIFNIAMLLAVAWFVVPILLSLVAMFLPFIGVAVAILIIMAIILR